MNFNSKAIFYTVVAFYSFQDTVPIFLFFFFKKKGGCSCLREVKSISKDIILQANSWMMRNLL